MSCSFYTGSCMLRFLATKVCYKEEHDGYWPMLLQGTSLKVEFTVNFCYVLCCDRYHIP